jgi:hypothetical protein
MGTEATAGAKRGRSVGRVVVCMHMYVFSPRSNGAARSAWLGASPNSDRAWPRLASVPATGGRDRSAGQFSAGARAWSCSQSVSASAGRRGRIAGERGRRTWPRPGCSHTSGHAPATFGVDDVVVVRDVVLKNMSTARPILRRPELVFGPIAAKSCRAVVRVIGPRPKIRRLSGVSRAGCSVSPASRGS